MNIFTKLTLVAALALPLTAFGEVSELTQKLIRPEAGKADFGSIKQAPAKAPSTEEAAQILELIEDPQLPTGRVIKLTQGGEAYQLYWGEPRYMTYDGISTEMLIGDDGYVYLKNPMSQFTTDSYLKGQKVDNTYVFDMPRWIYPADRYYGSGNNDFVTMLQYSATDQTYYAANFDKAKAAGLPEIENKLVLNINSDGSFSYKTDDDQSVIFGLVGSKSMNWNGYAEINTTWTPFTGELVTPPADLEVTEMAFTHDETGHYIKVGYKGNDVYMQGIFEAVPEAWIKGTKDEKSVKIPNGQYLGYYEYDNSQTYCMTVKYEVHDGKTLYDPVDELIFTIEDDGTLNAKGQAFMYTPGLGNTYYYALNDPVIGVIDATIDQTPQNPYNLIFTDNGSPDIPKLEFSASNLNKDGQLLNTDNLYYSIWADNEQYKFSDETYTNLEESTYYIPYNFNDSYDFWVDPTLGGPRRLVYLYFRGAKKIGVQMYNIDPITNDVLGKSEIIYTNVEDSSVESVDADKTVDSVKYYNLAGYEVANPDHGVYVKVVTYTDGTKAVSKLMK